MAISKTINKGIVGAVTSLLTVLFCHSAFSVDLSQSPLFLAQQAPPVVMLTMSVDHELFKKAYNDYSDLDGNALGMDDTTYRNNFTYYGYFDSGWCYTYTYGGYFSPHSATTNYRCSNTGGTNKEGAWSGNFLNWAAMSRIDVLRQVLYGGKRSTDTNSQTILERAYLPKDIHAFVKVYSNSDVSDFTPYTDSSISICNVSTNDSSTGKPIMRIASGKWRQWSASESVQCQWGDGNGTRPDDDTHELGSPTVRVEVCKSSKDVNSDRCKVYGSNVKPVGLLQTHGETGDMKFGLVTGSYKANLKGGVLRKEASLFASNADSTKDEVNLTTGIFNSVDGIVSNLNALRIAGYSFANSRYEDCDTHSIAISTVKGTPASNRSCGDWGNPLAELYLETLRYMTGANAPSTGFNVDDSTAGANSDFPGIAGLTNEGTTWTDPIDSDSWCTNCSVIVLSTGANSFDGDDLSGATSLDGIGSGTGEQSLNSFTDKVGNDEFGTFKGNYFNGVSGHCNAEEVNNLSDIKGICPELPSLEGTYSIAGLAYYANTRDIRSDRQDTQKIRTFAVDLAESLPSFSIPVGSGEIAFLPACEAKPGGGNWQGCSLIDVQVESLKYSGSDVVAGSYLFYWEDSLWGNDYDIDGAQRISFCVGDECASGGGLTHCANENGVCSFTGTRKVHYGAMGSFTELTATDSINCNNATFGDPIPGYAKACYYENDSTDAVASNQVRIDTSVPYAFAGNSLRFSFTVTGSTDDGLNDDWALRPGGSNFDALKDNPDSVPSNVESTSTVYTLGTTAATLLKKPLYYAAKYGGFVEADDGDATTTEDNDGVPNLASEWDVKINKDGTSGSDGIPDNYFSVSNPAELEKSLNSVFESIVADEASGSAAAANSTRLNTESIVYQARFSSIDWSGELLAKKLDADTGEVERVIDPDTGLEVEGTYWSTKDSANAINHLTRKVLTFNGSKTFDFTEANWAELTTAQQNALIDGDSEAVGKARLNWVRGQEINGLREREHIMGDIVNSDPVYAGHKRFAFQYLPTALGGDSYLDYYNGANGYSGKQNRKEVIYVNANDGMLHAIDASTGEELFTYLPSMVYDQLPELTEVSYGNLNNPHQYVLDGSIFVGDAYINGEWKNILVGTQGAGGRGLYVLDVTDPDDLINYTPSATDPAGPVLFELSEADYPELGHVLGKPIIAPMEDGWKLIIGNGYNSTGEQAQLLVIDLEDPKNYGHGNDSSAALSVGTSAISDGLAEPALLTDASGVVVAAYAGDLYGQMWKFDLDGNKASQWGVDYRLYSARDDNDNVQAITASPVLGLNREIENSIMVYFGTGSYFQTSDNTITSTVQSFYALADTGATISSSGSSRTTDLAEKTIYSETGGIRTVSGEWSTTGTTTNSAVDWDQDEGWFIDLLAPGSTSASGERVISKPLFVFDRLIFPTLIPSDKACEFGGSGWLMELVGVGDRYINHSVVGEDGIEQTDAVLALTSLIRSGENAYIPVSNIRGSLHMQSGNLPPGTFGRMSWRQLQ